MDAVGRAFEGKRVFVTGHTGFKGAWLCEWLLALRAEVWGYSLPPSTQPALFEQLGLARRLHHTIADVRDASAVTAAIGSCQPDFVFHLAAQPLVRMSYERPAETFATNVMGTAHVLEALRALTRPCAAVIVTSDKCYENVENGREHREGASLGGRDPYSASKAAAEIAVAAWRDSFFAPEKIVRKEEPPVALATARAGNVIGGGDWARDRILPDCLNALSRGEAIAVRNPASVRPWQHVLDPLNGYLLLGARLREALTQEPARLEERCSAYNFGPAPQDHCTVRELVEEVLKHWPGRWEDRSDPSALPEARLLHLSIEKAQRVLGWRPRWSRAVAVAKTVEWHRSSASASERTQAQIAAYSAGGDL